MESIQQALAIVFVFALLGGALYWLRRRGLATFRVKSGNGARRRMRTLDRLNLTAQHSLHLVSIGGKVLLVTVSPAGCTVVEGAEWGVSAEDMGGRS